VTYIQHIDNLVVNYLYILVCLTAPSADRLTDIYTKKE